MPASMPEILHVGERVLVEARTASEALDVVNEELGTSARIVAVDTVVRGGIAGFFARELVQVVAEPPVDADGAPRPTAGSDPELTGERDTGLHGVGERLAAELTDDVIRNSLGVHPGGHNLHDEAIARVETPPTSARGERGTSFADAIREASSTTLADELRAGHRSALRHVSSTDSPPHAMPRSRTGRNGVGRPAVAVNDGRSASSPVAIALTRLLSGSASEENFGAALRSELLRTGWRPENGSPARSYVRRVWAGAQKAERGMHDVEEGGREGLLGSVHPDEPAAFCSAVVSVEASGEAAPRERVVRADDSSDLQLVPDHPVDTPSATAASMMLLLPAEQSTVDRPAAAVQGAAATTSGRAAAWSASALTRLGLPSFVVDAVDGLESNDDGAWLDAIALSLKPLCGRLPAGDRVYAGPAARELTGPGGPPEATLTGAFHPDGDICVAIDDSSESRNTLAWLRDGRSLHLVVGDGRWRRLLLDDPAAVTCADVERLPLAISVAAEHDLRLGPVNFDPDDLRSANAVTGARSGADPDHLAQLIRALVASAAGDRP